MNQRVALGVQYDGSGWSGWQSQPGGQTIQDVLEAALARFADRPVRVVCAGRTDTGVHALGQVVHFDTDAPRDMAGWVRGTNALLPASVAVSWAQAVPDAFHARFSAVARTYHYVLYINAVRSPHVAGRAGWFYLPLDLAAMRAAAALLVGERDFSAFRSAQCQAKSPVKTLHSLSIAQHGDYLLFTFKANAFLHHMVRNLMGSLIAVGKGRETPEWIAQVQQSLDRSQAAATFMPDGLYLAAIDYPEAFPLPESPGLDCAFPGLRSR